MTTNWHSKSLVDVVELQRGHDLPAAQRQVGEVPIIGSFGVTGSHIEPRYTGPGVAIGRSGAAIGTATYVESDFWPLNTCLFVRDFKGNDPGWVYRLLDSIDFAGFNSGSAQPSLNRNYLRDIRVRVPSPPEQQAIAEVLGALDDKIAANERVAGAALELAEVEYRRGVADSGWVPVSSVLEAALGGTPKRSDESQWDGTVPWASAKDITGTPNGVILRTAEGISEEAATQRRFRPLPAGSVVLTARGTVGVVARLGVPAAINQSCYGFVPGEIPAGCLYFAMRQVSAEAKALAHGSVFDTITRSTLDYVTVPDLTHEQWSDLESLIGPMLDAATHAMNENLSLVATRDELLPLLMSGRLRVADAERVVSGAM